MAFLSVVGSLIGAFGQIQAGRQQQAVAEWNAARAEESARRSRAEGFVEAQLKEREGARLQGRQRALLAESGASLGEGTPLLIAQETAAETDFHQRLARANAGARAQQFQNQAIASRWEGGMKAQAATIGAGATLLSGFTKFASSSGWFGTTGGTTAGWG